MYSYDHSQECCPSCGKVGKMHIHGYYCLNIVDCCGGRICYQHIRIMRLRCCCGRTHAVLPDFIIPYCQYSVHFIMKLLIEYKHREKTVEELCWSYNVDLVMLKRWKKQARMHIEGWVHLPDRNRDESLLQSCSKDSWKQYLTDIWNDSCPSVFLQQFYDHFSYAFLQRHRSA